jgi:hypothetical protein
MGVPIKSQFEPDEMARICASLPGHKHFPERKALLPEILNEWLAVDFAEYGDSVPASKKMAKRLRGLCEKITALEKAFDSFNDASGRGVPAIALGRARRPGSPNSSYRSTQAEINAVRKVLLELSCGLEEEAKVIQKSSTRNTAPLYAVMDLAAIFEWVTGKKASLGINRIDGTPSGPFVRFLEAVWPLLSFGKEAKISSALKTWSEGKKNWPTDSAAFINMNFRHPEWKLSEQNIKKSSM